MKPKQTEWLQWLMVVLVLLATVSLAVKNNETGIVFNLCTLTFGYYFGSTQSTPPATKSRIKKEPLRALFYDRDF
jgi:hypothetical protein